MKRQRRLLLHKARISILVLMQLFTYAAYADDDASQPSTPELSADFIPKEGDGSLFNWLPGETYDPRTSTLGYYVTDMHVPGNGGLDIVVNRKFKMMANEATKGDERYPELFGSMSLDLPRIEFTTWETGNFTAGCEGLFVYNYKKFDDPKQLVSGLTFHANNTSVSFYPKHLDDSPASRFPASADYVSDKNWYIECSGPAKGAFLVHAPNGTVYHLTDYEQYRSKFLHPRLTSTPGVSSTIESARKKTVFVKKITDANGNSLTYSYDDETAIFYGRSIAQKVLRSIVSSDGRSVVVNHRDNVGPNCPKLINSITYDKDPSKTVNYIYDAIGESCQLLLNRVVRKDGSFFEYDYFSPLTNSNQPLDNATKEWPAAEPIENDPDNRMEGHSLFALKSITYPEGATVSYQYNLESTCYYTEEVVLSGASSTCAPKEFLKERSITGEIIPQDMTWTFRLQGYFDQTPKMLRSVIDGPAVNGRRTRQLFEYALSEANTDPEDASANSGKLLRHQVIDIPADAHTTGETGISLKITDYEWGFHAGVVDFSRLPRTWGWREILAWQHLHQSRGRRLIKKTITLDNHTFETQYLAFNQYGKATRHAQYQDEVGRTVAFEYLNQHSPWVIGKVSKKTVEKVDGSTDFMQLQRTFHNSGQVKGERVNGIYNSYTYHDNGELRTVKNGDSTEMASFASYTLGVPKYLKRRSSTGTAAKLVTLHDTGRIDTESAWDNADVKSAFTYHSNSGKLNTITPYTTEASVIHHPRWNPGDSGNGHFRRDYALTGDMQQITYNDTLGRPLIQFDKDKTHSDYVFTYYRYDANGRLAYQSLPVRKNYWSRRHDIYNAPMPAGYTFEYDGLGRLTKKANTVDHSKIRHCYSRPSCALANMSNNRLRHGKVTKDAEGYFTVVNVRAFAHPSNQHVIEIFQQAKGENYTSTLINRDLINRVTSVEQDATTRHYSYKTGTLLLASETHPETGKTQYTSYDNRGNLLRKESADGSATHFSYYPNNLVKAIDYPAGTDDMALAYYGDDSLKSIVSGDVVRSFTYRADGLLASETLRIDNETMTLSYEYDTQGFVNKTTYPSGQSVAQVNNTFGWVRKIPGVFTEVLYHSNGVMKEGLLSNKQKFITELDTNYRIKKWKTLDQDGDNDVQDLWYSYDSRGNITILLYLLDLYVDNDPQAISMGYDGLNRLTRADGLGLWGDGIIEYNRSGDITKLKLGDEELNYHYAHTFAPDRTKLLRHVSSTSGMNTYLFDYDRNGNVIDNGKRSFVYDKANRMTHADAGGRLYDFIYDGDGRRVRSIRQDTNDNNAPIASTKVTQYFFYNSAGKLMYEKNKNTGIRKDHIYANGRAIAERHYYNETVDTDSDGIPNHYEELYGLQPDNENDVYSDSDNDGVSNYQEFLLGSNPNSVDTDNDGINDQIEADYGMDIVEDDSAQDLDGDGVSNYNEIIAGSNPADTLVEQRMLAIVPILKILLAPDTQ